MTLLRYRFQNGKAYWYISLRDPGGNAARDVDLYRTEASEPAPATHAILTQLKAGETVYQADKLPKTL